MKMLLFIIQAHEQDYEFCSKCLEFIYICTKHERPRAGIENMWHLCDYYPLQRLVPRMITALFPIELDSASEPFSTVVNAATTAYRKLFAAQSLEVKYLTKSPTGLPLSFLYYNCLF